MNDRFWTSDCWKSMEKSGFERGFPKLLTQVIKAWQGVFDLK